VASALGLDADRPANAVAIAGSSLNVQRLDGIAIAELSGLLAGVRRQPVLGLHRSG
jgi:hypothetical protein